jgi:heme exporter protein D
MGAMDNWDVTLLVVMGYLAIVALVRLMSRRRDQLLDEFRRQIEEEQKRAAAEKAKKSA